MDEVHTGRLLLFGRKCHWVIIKKSSRLYVQFLVDKITDLSGGISTAVEINIKSRGVQVSKMSPSFPGILLVRLRLRTVGGLLRRRPENFSREP